MTEQQLSLLPFYTGWGRYTQRLMAAIAPLTDEQLALIASEVSVDEVQGYLLGRPLPAADIRRLLGAMTPSIPAEKVA